MNLDKIPISDIENYINIDKIKKYAILNMKYPDAAKLRDKQKLINNYRILDTIGMESIIRYVREIKINDIINDSI